MEVDGEGEEEDDISHHFYPRARLDSLLQVPDLASVGTIDTEDMAEMMKINREFDIKEFTKDFIFISRLARKVIMVVLLVLWLRY